MTPKKKTKKTRVEIIDGMKTKPKTKKVKCVLCHFAFPTDELANTCLWVHIMRRDKWFKQMTV